MNSTVIKKQFYLPVIFIGLLILAACGSDSDKSTDEDTAIEFNLSAIKSLYYDGQSDGLIAGLGLTGLTSHIPPGYIDSNTPTQSELRRNAIYANYLALVNQGDGLFGIEYGPKDDTKYPGHEYLVYVGSGINRATIMVQIPDDFNMQAPCIVAAPSSGSRGVYGAIGTSGAWGIEKKCAVAYTDMNKGTGAVDLTQAIGYDMTLNAVELSHSTELTFRIPTLENTSPNSNDYQGVPVPSQESREQYQQTYSHRLAFKHAHSQKNIEKDWALHTLQAIKFAFRQLNYQFPMATFSAENTLVIAASVSNGGGAALRAAEQDTESLIDAVVVAEPNINPKTSAQKFTIKMGDRKEVTNHSKPAYEYFLISELFAACASQDPTLTNSLWAGNGAGRGEVYARCDALVEAGLLNEGSYEALGAQSVAKLNDAAYLIESKPLLVGYAGIDLFQSLLATYGNAYSRSSVVDSLCHISMAAVGEDNQPMENSHYATLAATSNGIPRTANVVLIKDDAQEGEIKQSLATSSNGTKDYNLEGALCWQQLYFNEENPLNKRLLQGINEVKGSGNLQGIPTIIVHGRNDALIPVNHSSRPYYALSQIAQGDEGNIHYYEVTNAQHLDSLNGTYATYGNMSFVPLDYYFKTSLDMMYAHLTNANPLPASQVVKTTAPNGALKLSDLTPIQDTPEYPITFTGQALLIPE